MNERIRELMIKAGTDTSGKWMSVDNAEKFAELIVRDVVEQIIARERTDGEWYQYDIFKHFGVER